MLSATLLKHFIYLFIYYNNKISSNQFFSCFKM